MPNVTLRGIPDEVHAALKDAAKRNHRSLNGEILARLTASVPRGGANPEEILKRIQQRYEEIGPIDLDDETIRKLKNAGRP